MTPEKVLEWINTNLGYRFHAEDYEFCMLTHTRYLNLPGINAAYYASLDGKKVFKVTCEEIDVSSLPKEESKELKEALAIRLE